MYKCLNKLIDRKNLLGISFIGADVIEILVDSTAVPATLRKMRFMPWKHIPNFDPVRQEPPDANQKLWTRHQRAKAAYTRWYTAWTHAKSQRAKTWYAQKGESVYSGNSDAFPNEPERKTLQCYQERESQGNSKLPNETNAELEGGEDGGAQNLTGPLTQTKTTNQRAIAQN